MPRIPRIAAGPAPQGRRAVAGDFGADLGLVALGGAVRAVGDLGAQLLEMDQEARVSRATAQAAVEINDLQHRLQTDPDYPTHEERYQKETKEILDRTRKEISLPRFKGEFDAQMQPFVERTRLSVRSNADKQRIDFAKATLDVTSRQYADLTGQAQTREERDQLRFRFLMDIERSVANQVISQQEAVSRVQDFDDEVFAGEVRESLRIDPQQTVLELLDPKSDLARGVSNKQRQIWIDTGIRAYEADLRAEEARANRERIEADRLDEEAIDAALKVGDDFIIADDMEGLERWLRSEEIEKLLPPDKRRYYYERLAAGGGFGADESNRVALVDFEFRATLGEDDPGEDIRNDIRIAFENGDITDTDRRRLLAKVDDVRFGDAEDHLKASLHVGEKAVDNVFVSQARSAEAMRDFTNWKLAHPDATRADALAQAEQLIRDAALVELDNMSIAPLRPSYMVFKGDGTIDIGETKLATADARDRGDLDDFEFDQQMQRIDRIDRAQKQMKKQPRTPVTTRSLKGRPPGLEER